MTEYAEELYEDEDFEGFEDEELFEEYDEEEARRAQVSTLVAAWERENGIELTDEEFNEMGIRVAVGIPPDEAYARTDPGRFEADFEATVEAVEREQGRQLLESEVDRMWEAAERAADDPAVETDAAVWAEARKATPNMLDTSDGVAEYIGQRLSVPQERTEASAVQVDEDGDELPSFNVSDPDERTAAIDAAMSGEAVSTHDNDDLGDD